MMNKFQCKTMDVCKAVLILIGLVQLMQSQTLKDECGLSLPVSVTQPNCFTIHGRVLTPEYDAAQNITVSNLYDTVVTDSAGKFTIAFPAAADSIYIIISSVMYMNQVIIFQRSGFKASDYFTVFTDNIVLNYAFYPGTSCSFGPPALQRPKRLFERIFRNRLK